MMQKENQIVRSKKISLRLLIGSSYDQVAVLGHHDALLALKRIAFDRFQKRAWDASCFFDTNRFK